MRWFLWAILSVILCTPAHAGEPMKVVATFSILGDLVQAVGGDRVEVTTLVGPDEDAHIYEPKPTYALALAGAKAVFVNGLGFEGWIDRLIAASGTSGQIVVVSHGVKVRRAKGSPGRRGHRHAVDPHAWQNLENGAIYVDNIATALIGADPQNAAFYRANARRYSASLLLLHSATLTNFAALDGQRRKIVTSHDVFGYFADAYGLAFLAPKGLSTRDEPSAADVARLIRQIRRERIAAVFVENMSDRRIVDQIARETGARTGGTLYADALSAQDGPASSYVRLFQHNSRQILNALSPGS
jgi:zinc/manganese transport system substrate-binding protein